MNPEEPLPESAKRAFDSYPQIEAAPTFNRAVLDALHAQQNKRSQTFIGKIEEFLGVGLWSFAASGALGALLPGAVLGAMVLSGGSSSPQSKPLPAPFGFPMSRYTGPLYARELERRSSIETEAPARIESKELSCFPKSPVA